MKNKIAQFLMLVGLTVGLAVFAQAQVNTTFRANIPFDFIVGEKSFRAGDYSISFGTLPNMPESFLLRSADGKQSIIVAIALPTESDKNGKEDRLVFNASNEHHYLAAITTYQKSVELPDSHSKEKTKRQGKRVEVALAK